MDVQELLSLLPDKHSFVIYLSAVATMFATTFLRGFQNKNVAGGYIKLAGIVGYVMAVCDMLTIGLVVKGGMNVAFVGAIGAGVGWMVGMHVHKMLLRKREQERARRKKIKKQSKRETMIQQLIDDRLQELDLIGEQK